MPLPIQIQDSEWEVIDKQIHRQKKLLKKMRISYNDILKGYQLLIKKLSLQQELDDLMKELMK